MKKGQQTAKSVETKKKIRAAALDLFCSKGYDKSTMRDIAKRAGVSVGSTYYYFRTKEELVLDFYTATQDEAAKNNEILVNESTRFKKRLDELLTFRFRQLTPYRSFIGVLGRNAADRNHALSPFGKETKSIRDESIALFSQIIEGSNLKYAKELQPFLPVLLWLYQMGLVFFWIYDSSEEKSRTRILQTHTMSMMINLIRLSKIPIMKPVNRSLVTLMRVLGIGDTPSSTQSAIEKQL